VDGHRLATMGWYLDDIHWGSAYGKLEILMMNATKKQISRGFTIVELLIVIVVIGILAAITIVAFNGVQEKAKVSAAKSFASQIKHRDLSDATGYWAFDECSGTALVNGAGNATSQTNGVTGTTSFSADTPSGTGCSLSLNGSSYINTGMGLSNTYYSKSMWMKTAATGTAMNLISDVTGGTQSAFYLETYRPSAGHNGGWNTVLSQMTLNDNKWHFMFNEFKLNPSGTNGTMTLSVDGVTVATNSNTPLMGSPSNAQGIGTFGATSNFTGLIDDPMIVVR